MGRREDLVACFEDTLSLCSTGELRGRVEATKEASRLIGADEALGHLPVTGMPARTEVTGERTFDAARRLLDERAQGRVGVLNFCSPTTPGGGVRRGATAQEECLCRCSTLYPALAQERFWHGYYEPNRRSRDPLATDACIYSPDVVVVKRDGDLPQGLAPSEWFDVDVITCAAPNLRWVEDIPDERLLALHERRAARIIEVAAHFGIRTFVSGAFGCGAFRCDAYLVARAWRRALAKASSPIERVVFAVWCRPGDTYNLDAFKETFGSRLR